MRHNYSGTYVTYIAYKPSVSYLPGAIILGRFWRCVRRGKGELPWRCRLLMYPPPPSTSLTWQVHMMTPSTCLLRIMVRVPYGFRYFSLLGTNHAQGHAGINHRCDFRHFDCTRTSAACQWASCATYPACEQRPRGTRSCRCSGVLAMTQTLGDDCPFPLL